MVFVVFFFGLGFVGFLVLWLFLVSCRAFFFNLGNSRSSGHHHIHSFSSYIRFFLPL